MSSSLSTPVDFSVLGVNHRTAGGALRERLASEDAELPALLTALQQRGVRDGLWLSTCDRTEIWFAPRGDVDLGPAIKSMLAERAAAAVPDLEGELVALTGEAALRHAFAVTASLDSQVVGEPHILGQVKAAHRAAITAGLCGSHLDIVLQNAYALAKRIRSETALAEGATSIVAAALQVARGLHGAIAQCSALLLGNGDMGVMILEGLQSVGLSRFAVTAPLERRAQAVVRRLGGETHAWNDLSTALVQADIVIAAGGTGNAVLDSRMVEATLRRRRRRPIFIIDAAVPADVDPAATTVDDAYVYDLGDLEKVVLAGRARREAALKAAWALLEGALEDFARCRAERRAVPLVVALRAHFDAERRRVLTEHGGLDAGAATRLLVNRLLHHPTTMLRSAAADDNSANGAMEQQAEMERMIARLFGLDGDTNDNTD